MEPHRIISVPLQLSKWAGISGCFIAVAAQKEGKNGQL